jgi:hypothetical protein
MAGYIGSKASVVSSGVERKKTYSITGSTTSLTGLNYTVGKVHVYQNGVRLLDGTDYTATNGTSITLTVAAQSGDNVVVVSQASFQLSESYTSTEADAEFVTKTGDTMTGNLSFGDNDQAIFGAGSDLQIYHDGSNSYIRETGTGNLNISADQLRVLNASNNEIKAEFTTDGAVDLYHNNALKLATTATGISVSGTVNATTALFSGYIDFQTGGVNKGNIYTDASTMIINTQGTNTTLNTNGGNVGIGTSSPSTKLSVTGGYISQVNAGVSTYLGEDGSGGSLVGTTSNHYFRFITNNTERMRIDSSGNVGIGTSSPGESLTVNGAIGIGGNKIYNGAASNSAGVSFPNSTVRLDGYNGITFHSSATTVSGQTERMRITSAGNVGIGRTDPSQLLEVHKSAGGNQTAAKFSAHNYGDTGKTYIELGTEYGDGSSRIGSFNTSGNKSALVFEVHANTSGSFSEKMRIDESGNLLVGKTSTAFATAGVALYSTGTVDIVNTGVALSLNRTGANGGIQDFYKSTVKVGSISVTGSSTSYNTSSDYRLKENVVDLTGASARVNQLNPSRFNWIADETNTLVDGFLAHEVADVVPEAITGAKDAMRDEEYEVTPAVLDDDGNVTTEAVMGTRSVPDYQGIDQSKLVPLLTAALQEALTEIASLKTRVEALEA